MNESEKHNLKNIELFLQNYQNTLQQIYLSAYNDHGKGLLFVDINSNNNGNCDTKYTNVEHLNENMNEIKEKIKLNTSKKIFLYLIDKETNIIIEKEYV